MYVVVDAEISSCLDEELFVSFVTKINEVISSSSKLIILTDNHINKLSDSSRLYLKHSIVICSSGALITNSNGYDKYKYLCSKKVKLIASTLERKNVCFKIYTESGLEFVSGIPASPNVENDEVYLKDVLKHRVVHIEVCARTPEDVDSLRQIIDYVEKYYVTSVNWLASGACIITDQNTSKYSSVLHVIGRRSPYLYLSAGGFCRELWRNTLMSMLVLDKGNISEPFTINISNNFYPQSDYRDFTGYLKSLTL